MAVDQSFVIKKLQNMEEMYAVYSAVTKMPFATCDEETFNDQVWVFADKEKVQEFSQKVYGGEDSPDGRPGKERGSAHVLYEFVCHRGSMRWYSRTGRHSTGFRWKTL